jgi:dihydropteroate synthase
MHMKGTPKSMQADVHYDDLWGEIIGYLRDALKRSEAEGILSDNIIVGPGYRLESSLSIISRSSEILIN